MLDKVKLFFLEGYVKKLIPFEFESMSDSYNNFNRFWRWSLWLAVTFLVGILISAYLISNLFLHFVDNSFTIMLWIVLILHFGVFPFLAMKFKNYSWILKVQLILLTCIAGIRLFQFGHINEPVLFSYLIVPVLAFCLGEYLLGMILTCALVFIMGQIVFIGHIEELKHVASLSLRARTINFMWSYTLIFSLLMVIRLKRHIITKKLKQLIFKLMTERKFLHIFEIQKWHQAVITSLNHDMTNPITVLLYSLSKIKSEYIELATSASRHLNTISSIIKNYTEKENENMQIKFQKLETTFSKNHGRYTQVIKNFNDDFYPIEHYSVAFSLMLFFFSLLTYFNMQKNEIVMVLCGFIIPSIILFLNNLKFKIPYLSSVSFGLGVLISLFLLCLSTGAMYSPFLVLLLSFVFIFILVERLKLMIMFFVLTNLLMFVLFKNSTELSSVEIEATNAQMFLIYSLYVVLFSALTVLRDKKSEQFYANVFDFKNTMDNEANDTLKVEKLVNFQLIQAELYDSLKFHFDEVDKFVKDYAEFYPEIELSKIHKSLSRMDSVLAQIEMLIISGPEYKQYAKDIEMMSLEVKKDSKEELF